MDEVEIVSQNETTPDLINRILSRQKDKDPYFEDAFVVTDLGNVCRKMLLWRQHLPRVEPFYAVKCNDDMKILSTMVRLGSSFDCCSRDEMSRVFRLGCSPSNIVFAHPVKQPKFLRYAAEKGVRKMVIDCEEELKKIKAIYPKASLIVRIRPSSAYNVEYKLSAQYGCHMWEVQSILHTAKTMDLDVVGVSFHAGSGIIEGRVFMETVRMADQVFAMASEIGFSMSLLDIGGGFFGNNRPKVQFAETAANLNEALDTYFPLERGVKIIAEPGRFFVSSAATLALPIIGKKIITQKGTEADNHGQRRSRMYFLNDGRFGSFSELFYSTYNSNKPSILKAPENKELYPSSVWGPTLAPSDCIFQDCELPDLEQGEWLYFDNMGAYSITLNRGDIKFNGVESPKMFYVCCKEMLGEMKLQRL